MSEIISSGQVCSIIFTSLKFCLNLTCLLLELNSNELEFESSSSSLNFLHINFIYMLIYRVEFESKLKSSSYTVYCLNLIWLTNEQTLTELNLIWVSNSLIRLSINVLENELNGSVRSIESRINHGFGSIQWITQRFNK